MLTRLWCRGVFMVVVLLNLLVRLPALAQSYIDYGTTINGYLNTGGANLYQFDGIAGDAVYISLSSPNFDTTLRLIDTNDTELAYDDDGGIDLNSLINGYVLPRSGDYLIVVRSFADRGSGDYTLFLDVNPGTGGGTSSILYEDFTQPSLFSTLGTGVAVNGGYVSWNVRRSGAQQYIYRAIPYFSGDVQLTVSGSISNWTNNCSIRAGIGDAVGSGLSVNFGYIGGGCGTNGTVVWGSGVSLDASEASCNFSGNWLWINPSSTYDATLRVEGGNAMLSVPGVGTSYGYPTYAGGYQYLYVGLTGDGDWPECSGYIESMTIEPLQGEGLPPPPPTTGDLAYGGYIEDSVTSSGGDRWSFYGYNGDAISIVMASRDFDTYLELLNPNGTQIVTNDDGGNELDSRIDYYTLPMTGTYTIVARAFSSGTGDYVLFLWQH